MGRFGILVVGAIGLCQPVLGSVLFDFDNAPLHGGLPASLTVEGITANFSATGQGFSFQEANVLGFTPVGFSGYCIYPDSIYAADLQVSFSDVLTDFSILYAPEEYGCDTSAVMKVTAYLDGVLVGSNTAQADPPGTWPTATLSFNSVSGFNSVVVHYLTPPSGENWGPIFMADNMSVSAVPEPASLTTLGIGLGGGVLSRRGRKSLT